MGKPVTNSGKMLGSGINTRDGGYDGPRFNKDPKIEIEKLKRKIKEWEDLKSQTKKGSTGYFSERYFKLMIKSVQQALKEVKYA